MTLRFQITLILVLAACHSLSAQAQYLEVCQPVNSHVRIKVVGCLEREVTLPQCTGSCLSEDLGPGLRKTCWCCKPVETVKIPVQINCKIGNIFRKVQHEVQYHRQCTCSRCLNH